ncbi:PREDICTED: uncharacterized protein LOC108577620 [Habropoda laboriosa]|uniref:uncharacterized protein LOC108577620 n=1 Tax=Habropoda laboriosa TaxID=597456 RepID=UPI00083CDBAA|nr:PREDICTED: uncharacterized protein LOC108577620 [Habropoda laboriosa]
MIDTCCHNNVVTLVLLLATVSVTLTRSQVPEISGTGLDATQAPIKLDKNLRRALLKALTDLETESAEQHKEQPENIAQRDTTAYEAVLHDNPSKDVNLQKAAFSFKSFPGDEDTPSEDKLQNSSFVEAVRYVTLKAPAMNIEKASQDDARSFHVQNVILPEKNQAIFGAKTEANLQQKEKIAQASVNTFAVDKVESLTLKPATLISESLARSSSNGITAVNPIVSQKPIEGPTPTSPSNNLTVTPSSDAKDKTEEVKIFQAPLVAAFTVQQDEQGIPKSVVPIFRSPNDGQALTLQEQLEFKQQLLEKQLAELQQQQLHQTQFLARQQQLYEQQIRQKQYQQYYLQEQARIKQLEEQAKLKRLEEQRIKQLEEQRFKYEEQRLNRFQPQRPPPQKQFFFEQSNSLLSFQPPVDSNVHLQPSLALEVPNVAGPPPFQPIFQQDPPRLQPFRQQPQQHQQLQQPQQHQQKLQQSFSSFSNDFQPSISPTGRFNRQEAFNAIGNFGFNEDNKVTPSRNNFGFNVQQRTPANYYHPFTQYRQTKPPTPAKQIQHLLYQSGIAGDLSNVQGIGNNEDLNIVSKVLALNVGAVSNKNNLQFMTNPAASSFGNTSA